MPMNMTNNAGVASKVGYLGMVNNAGAASPCGYAHMVNNAGVATMCYSKKPTSGSYLYNQGDQAKTFTGGWARPSYNYMSHVQYWYNWPRTELTFESVYIQMHTTRMAGVYQGTGVVTNNKVNLSSINTLTAHFWYYEATDGYWPYCHLVLGITDSVPTSTSGQIAFSSTGARSTALYLNSGPNATDVTLDVSSVSSAYVYAGIAVSDNNGLGARLQWLKCS